MDLSFCLNLFVSRNSWRFSLGLITVCSLSVPQKEPCIYNSSLLYLCSHYQSNCSFIPHKVFLLAILPIFSSQIIIRLSGYLSILLSVCQFILLYFSSSFSVVFAVPLFISYFFKFRICFGLFFRIVGFSLCISNLQ